MANPEAEKRKRESERKAKDREDLAISQSRERLKLSQNAKKAKITLVTRQKRERESMKETKKLKEAGDWIENDIIYKLLDKDEVRAAKVFNAMNKREKMKFLDTVQTITSRHHDYSDDAVVDALDDHGIDISKKARKRWEETELQQEAENMHKYVNTLSLERSVNLWAEAAKEKNEGKAPEPVSGSKTLTKKNQNQIKINPIEKEPQNKSA